MTTAKQGHAYASYAVSRPAEQESFGQDLSEDQRRKVEAVLAAAEPVRSDRYSHQVRIKMDK